MSKRDKLQEAIDQIQEICRSHGVHSQLEKIIGEEDGAMMRVAYVKPVNKTAYLHELMGMPRKSDAPDLVEAEAELTITRESGSFEITKDGGTKVLDQIRPRLEEFYAFEEDAPWHKIDEDQFTRRLLYLFLWGHSFEAIADSLAISGKNKEQVVKTKLTRLRQKYGEQIVPLMKDRGKFAKFINRSRKP